MNTLFYSQLDEPSLEKITSDIETKKPDHIVLFCETEWESRELTIELATLLNAHNVKLSVTFCSFPSDFYNERAQYFNNIDIIHWPTYWLHWTKMCSGALNFNVEYIDFKFPYICLNNKNHKHRCQLIDHLARNNLLDKGIVTWHRFPGQHPSPYQFKYYNDDIRLISDDFITKLDSFLIPNEYHQSFLHVVGEATTKVTCISEKTWLPILFKKPWVVMADQYFHQKLVDLGFELYDEIIDYSFDSYPDMENRAYAISENVKRICEEKSIYDLYKKIKPKADRNYENYMRILKDESYVPQIIKDRARYSKETNYASSTFTDPRYVEICEKLGLI